MGPGEAPGPLRNRGHQKDLRGFCSKQKVGRTLGTLPALVPDSQHLDLRLPKAGRGLAFSSGSVWILSLLVPAASCHSWELGGRGEVWSGSWVALAASPIAVGASCSLALARRGPCAGEACGIWTFWECELWSWIKQLFRALACLLSYCVGFSASPWAPLLM